MWRFSKDFNMTLLCFFWGLSHLSGLQQVPGWRHQHRLSSNQRWLSGLNSCCALCLWKNVEIGWLLYWRNAPGKECFQIKPKWQVFLPMQGWGLQARPSSTVPSHTASLGWHVRLRTWTPPPHSWLHTDQRPQLAQPSARHNDSSG